MEKTLTKLIQEVAEDICNNYCKYRDTSDEDSICEPIREGKPCPLDRLL